MAWLRKNLSTNLLNFSNELNDFKLPEHDQCIQFLNVLQKKTKLKQSQLIDNA